MPFEKYRRGEKFSCNYKNFIISSRHILSKNAYRIEVTNVDVEFQNDPKCKVLASWRCASQDRGVELARKYIDARISDDKKLAFNLSLNPDSYFEVF